MKVEDNNLIIPQQELQNWWEYYYDLSQQCGDTNLNGFYRGKLDLINHLIDCYETNRK